MIENNAVKVNLEKGAVETGKGIGKLADAFFNYLGQRDEKKQDRKMLEMLNNGKFDNSNYLVTYNSTNLSLTPQSSIEERARVREEAQSIRKQENLERVVIHASNELLTETDISDEPLNETWKNRFFDMASDISEEEMQILWGKILAGEIKHPNTYSLRTLEALRNMTTDEAQLFHKVSQFLFTSDDMVFIFIPNKLMNRFDIGYHNLMTLEECGLMSTHPVYVGLSFSEGNVDRIAYSNYSIRFTRDTDSREVRLPVYPLTRTGTQIYNLFVKEPNHEYFEAVVAELKSKNPEWLPNSLFGVDVEGEETNPLTQIQTGH